MAAALLRNATIAANASLAGDASGGIEPSPLTCIGLSAFGGFLEVASTMCLAYPEYLEKLGTVYSKCRKRAMMALNLALMGVASVAYIVGSWYGPVSLSVRRHGLEVAADGRGAPHGQILKGPAGGPNPGLLPTRCPPLTDDSARVPAETGGHLLHRVRHTHAARRRAVRPARPRRALARPAVNPRRPQPRPLARPMPPSHRR